ncbi:tetratricopeptide repeat protein [Marinobacter zhejiangensis]|uniref:Tetratricopeptide repeat-containing protein n=1 Tax=Marinobacter zhejiangensis TaxID=488535 RepID=A0A1I4RQJ2_9GAMM|nr:tetratricopeptide repeat protein [Marinobacter zhejiangensis]SFM54542.1 Tetratricopeptide repeat-containing protein [Marinobacter zhejiangensis]
MTIVRHIRRALAAGTLMGSAIWAPAISAQESFQVNLNQDGDTIGDMRPVYLQYRAQALPAISPREAARRYQQLFEQSDEPEVRIDALNRLSNLQQLAEEDLRFSPEKEMEVYQDALGSYDEILGRGAFQGRLDELLYQMAKAHAYVGQNPQSIARLKQMVGLYPDSSLVPEARFRIAEAAFSAGQYREAELMYRQVLNDTAASEQRSSQSLNDKAHYMLGWAQYKQGAFGRASASFLEVLDKQNERTQGFGAIPAASLDMIDDTFRIIAIMAAKQGGEAALGAMLDGTPDRGYVSLLYDRLVDFYVGTGEYLDAVEVANAFIERYPDNRGVPAFRVQNVDVFMASGDSVRAWRARESFVEAYQSSMAFESLGDPERQRWWEYCRMVADHYYRQASEGGAPATVKAGFSKASGYYAVLADRVADAGEILRLAGDSALQAGDYPAANRYYRRAAYSAGSYPGAADAGWASLILEREGLAEGSTGLVDLPGYAASADRFALAFPDDHRLGELQADVAGRLLAANDYAGADRFAGLAIGNAGEDSGIQYNAWLVAAESLGALARHSDAEHAWRQALALTAVGSVVVSVEEAQTLNRQLATSIYRQGEVADRSGDLDRAIAHYQRIEAVAPGSEVAVKGRFDATNALLHGERWQAAINELQRFRQDYPADRLTPQISEKLVYAYQASGQPVRAADELVQHGSGDWQTRLRAAELYHAGAAEPSRNAIYQAFLAQGIVADSPDAHIQHQRIRQRLVESAGEAERGDGLRRDIVETEQASRWHSEETLAWAAQAALALGVESAEQFEAIALVYPLSESLAKKQRLMESAKAYFNLIQQFSDGPLYSESLYRRAELYRAMARDLMASSRPPELTELELMQYEMLLEEQAFPFEELAIEVHEENHQQLAQGQFDEWVQRSLQALAELHPGRYAREMQWMGWDNKSVTQREDDA